MTTINMIRGPLLNPRAPGSVDYFPDGGLVGDESGKVVAVGAWPELSARFGAPGVQVRAARGWLVPVMLDAHIHIPQHSIRGRFLEGITGSPEGGPLLAGLNRNVFPAEGRCAEPKAARKIVEEFRIDTLAHGVVGGAAYQTVHPDATRAALELLPDTWHVGLVLMQRFCPIYLRTNEATLEEDVVGLASDFGARLIMTDRFAGAVDTPLRRRGVALARQHNLRMQTHLNEQLAEKAWIEGLYPQMASYTDVYRQDGLLAQAAILAHCIRMQAAEFEMLATATASGAAIAHCPVSNTLLGSGVMPLDEITARGIPYALCTDVGASPTTSLLCEMLQFLRVHRGRSSIATPQEALFRTTLAPARILGLADRIGSFEPGKEMSFVEIKGDAPADADHDVDRAILQNLLGSSDAELARYEPEGELGRFVDVLEATGLPVAEELTALTDDVNRAAAELDAKVVRVTLQGQVVWSRA